MTIKCHSITIFNRPMCCADKLKQPNRPIISYQADFSLSLYESAWNPYAKDHRRPIAYRVLGPSQKVIIWGGGGLHFGIALNLVVFSY